MKTSPFHYSGIADEAGPSIDCQIAAHRELGWQHIELRNIHGVAVTDLPETEFRKVADAVGEAGLEVSGFASPIANWATKITDDFALSLAALRRAISRMQAVKTRFLRVMSYPNNHLPLAEWRGESVRRLKTLGRIAEDAGIVLMVENCDGWASSSLDAYRTFIEEVNSPAVKTVYDTGNPASHGHPDTWEWYQAAKPHLAYVHIKAHTGPKGRHAWPDEGFSCVEETLRDLLADAYEGFVSIEPHIQNTARGEKRFEESDIAYASYVEYGRRLENLARRIHSPR